MIIDTYGEFCDATALGTSGTGYALVGNVIDLGADGEHIAAGKPPMFFNMHVTTAVTSAGAATVSFILASDATSSIQTDGSATEHIITDAIAKATLVAGFRLSVPLPTPVGIPYERYLGVIQNVGTAALTAGAIDAFLTLDSPAWKAMPDAIN